MNEWPLILYTLFLQSAVGIYVVSQFTLTGEADKSSRMRFLWIVGGLGVAGVLASFLHLGSPASAFGTLSNLATSWLSREILLTILFGSAWLVTLLLEMRQVGSRALRTGWAVVGSVLGISLVFAMSMIYRSLAFPAWAHLSTTVSFLATAGLIGTASVFAGQCLRKGDEEPACATPLLFGALAMLLLQVVTVSAHAAYLGGAGKEAQMTAALLSGDLAVLLWARVALVVLGAAVIMPLAWRRMATKNAGSLVPLGAALVTLVTVGELLGRFLFYTTGVKIGL